MYYAEFQLMIKLVHRCPNTPCDDALCLNKVNRLEYEATNLDLLDISPSILATSVPSTVARRRLDPIFDPEKLLDWLRRSEFDELQRSSSIENKASSSLDTLFHANRFRVLDVETSEIVVLRYLTRFLALSYVWGNVGNCSSAIKRQSCCNSSFSAHECATSVDVKQLPWTIQDSIGLLKRIGQRYLWVDALCIYQDDANDKAAIIPEMGSIYGNAYLTIVAADGSHSNDRLSRLVNGKPPEEWIPITTRLGETLLSPARPTIDQAMAKSTWNMRGWTFQERLLSRRCVLFTKDGVYFDCSTLRASEAYEFVPNGHNGASLGLGDAYDAFHSDRGLRLDRYATVLSAYSKRKLSHRGDRLDAFTGILRHLQPQGISVEQIEALSGLPFGDFISSLHWSGQVKPRDSYRLKAGLPKQLKPLRKMNRLILDARRSCYLPSWSWSGWEGSVVLDDSVFWLSDPKVQLWHSLAEPTVINAANIVCHTPYSATKFEPELSRAAKPLRVMLHMWVKAWPCILVPRAQQGTDTIYAVEPRRLQTDIPQDEDEENEVILPEGVDPSSTFELLCLHDKSQRYILVREVDSFMERVDLVYHPYLRRLSSEFVVKYVRLC